MPPPLDGGIDATLPPGDDAGDASASDSGDAQPDAPQGSEAGPALPPGPTGPSLPPATAYDIYTATQFLYTGSSPEQSGVAAGTIQRATVGVVRGAVTARDGSPLSGVTIRVLGHPEYGQSTSQANGGFDLVLNAGSTVTLDFVLTGYLNAQRSVVTRLRDFVAAPPTALVALDATVTTVNLTSNTMQVALGSKVQDQSGARQAILMFPSGTQATMDLPDGGTAPLNTLSVRATEFTVGATGVAAMPGTLPPTSSYTYAAEISVDEAMNAGATKVTLSQPVPLYVDDIVGFGPGIAVPAGYYDRAQAKWVASDDGLVVKILSTNGGVAAIDLDGSGTAASSTTLGTLGISNEELTRLAALRSAGDVLWRTPLTHFTPWDCNWPNAPPKCAAYPNGAVFDPSCPPLDPLGGPYGPNQLDDCDKRPGSIIGCSRQTLGEALDIAGTPFFLRYDTGRTRDLLDRFSTIIPLTGPTLPPGLESVVYDVQVAGRDIQGSAPPSPNLSVPFTWDGLDAYGRPVPSAITAQIQVGYVYDGVYLTSTRGSQLDFGAISSGTASVDKSRNQITLYGPAWQVQLSVPSYQSQIGDGWSISPVHAYDPALGVVHLGTGDDLGPPSPPPSSGAPGTLVPVATDTTSPASILGSFAVARDGTVYALRATSQSSLPVTKIAPGGVETKFTPTLLPSNSFNLQFGSDGSLYYEKSDGTEIDRLDPSGQIHPVATQAQFPQTTFSAYALGADHKLYTFVLQSKASPCTGSIVGIDVGTGVVDVLNQSVSCTYDASKDKDGVPIGQAWFSLVLQIAAGDDGSLYFVEEPGAVGAASRIRRMRPDGRVATIFTEGNASSLVAPIRIAVAPSGAVYACGASNGSVTGISGLNYDESIWLLAGDGSAPQLRIGTNGAAPKALQPGGLASSTATSCLLGVGVDGTGALYTGIAGTTLDTEGIWRTSALWPLGAQMAAFEVPDTAASEVYFFDAAGHHLRTVDAATGSLLWQFAYDTNGYVTSLVDGDGNTTHVNRSAAGDQITIVAPFGQTTTVHVDSATGHVTSIADPIGNAYGFGYLGSSDLLSSFTDPNGGAPHVFTYDSLGRLQEDVSASGSRQILAMTQLPNGREVDVTTGLGRKNVHRVETLADGSMKWTTSGADGLPTISTRAADLSTSTSASPDGTKYSTASAPDPRFGMQAAYPSSSTVTTPSGLVYATTTARTATLTTLGDPLSATSLSEATTINGNTWSSVHDVTARTVTTTSPMGRIVTIGLDALARPVSLAAAGTDPVTWTYDTNGRPSAVTMGKRSTTFSYDALGDLATVTDPSSLVTTLGFDPDGHFASETWPDSNGVALGYDADGNVKGVTPPGRPQHGFSFFPGDLTHSYDPPAVAGSGTTSTDFSYDGDDRLASVARSDGVTVTPVFDAKTGKLSNLTTPTGTTTFAYDDGHTGLLTSIAAPGNVHLTFAYDGALVTAQTWSGAVTGSYARTFDASFRVASDSVNGANTIAYGYDNDDLLTSAGAETMTLGATNGLLMGSTLGSVIDALTYDEYGSIATYAAKYGGTELYSVDYGTRDPLGRISTRTETVQGTTTTHSYDYDARGRLWHVSVNGSLASTYAYDANGNRTAVVTPGGTTAATFDLQDRMLTDGGASFTYGANGEVTTRSESGQTTSYVYDAIGNLRKVTLPGGKVVEYLIDGENRRVGKLVNGALTKQWLYRGSLRPIAELDASGAVTNRFVYGAGWTPEQILRGATTYRVISDELSNPRLVVNASTGAVAESLSFDDWGNVVTDTSPGFQPFGFAGGIRDEDTGLVHLGARDYDPSIGRWLSKDATLFRGGYNVYVYCENDPVNFADRLGFYPGEGSQWNAAQRWLLEQDDNGNLAGLQNFFAGFSNALTFGVSDALFNELGVDNDPCADAYTWGQVTGVVLDTAVGAAAGARAAGSAGRGLEFSHWIPNRFGGPRTILNGNYVSAAEHALSDPFRYRFMPRAWKASNPAPSQLVQQWSRLPKILKGAGAGAAYGSGGLMTNCRCRR